MSCARLSGWCRPVGDCHPFDAVHHCEQENRRGALGSRSSPGAGLLGRHALGEDPMMLLLADPQTLSATDTVSRRSTLLLTPSVATIPVGGSPLGVTLTPDGGRAYVANQSSDDISVIDTATNTVTVTIAAPGGPRLLSFSPDGTRAYVTLFDTGSVGVIDTATNVLTTTIPVGAGAVQCALTPDGTRAYVTCQTAGVVSVIDTTTNSVTTPITGLSLPTGAAVSPDGARVYVPNAGDGTVAVIDTATNTVSASILTGDVPILVALTPDGTRAYVSVAGENAVKVIDTATNTVTAAIPVGNGPRMVAMSPDGTAVYVADLSANTVTVIDTATNTAVDSIPVGNSPIGVAVSPDASRLYVTNSADNTVSVIALTLMPGQGSTAGGTIVTIRGHNLAAATAVHFGGAAATILSNTATSVTVRTPPGSGAVPVTVTTPGGTGGFGTFVYRPAPLLSGISTTSNPYGGAGPAMGPVTGGGTAVITGVNLSGATAVRFGSRQAVIQSVTDTAITVTVPSASSPGPVPVTVVTPGGTAGGLTFTYVAGPTVSGVVPTTGRTAGGTDVTLTGTGLATTHQVTFDGVFAPFTVVSDTTVTAIAPPHTSADNITITVTTLGGTTSWSGFSYQDPTI
ncbi:putative IPT/TIG domain protein [Streptomyces himastatinicus ATCC 53653]|uniref:Putative IPT/TIG domain protein n=2 Tax=Streptomyces violaceusniger group TaxID=2839105 RepID=D9WWF4_9ACTN|nr:putative IPT/TIG domain protein [Streptomyces himastatinicus ATCC 53653]